MNNDKVIAGVSSAGNKGNNASSKHTEVVKGSTTSNAGNASSNQANAANFNKNITDLHKNAMHIKKLNFQAGGRQMQSNATQPVIAHPQS